MRLDFAIVPALCLLSLSACDTGTPPYFGIAPQRVEAGGMVYDVRVRGLMAEALRQNTMAFPRDEEIALTAAAAMRQVTGCEVLELRGDPSVVEGRLQCDADKAPKFAKTGHSKVFYCTFERLTRSRPEMIDDYLAVCV